MSTISSYKDLVVWQKSIAFITYLYKLTRRFPREETYGLTSQMRRAASSIPANIAEGSARGYIKEYNSFLSIAYGSGAELETFLVIAKELNYIASEECAEAATRLDEIMKMLNGLIRKLKAKTSSHLVPNA